MRFSPAQVLGIALVADHINRQNNYEEMVDRLQDHIDRWKKSIQRLENAQDKIRKNIYDNNERLLKAKSFLIRMSEQKTQDWLQRQKSIAARLDHSRSLDAAEKVRKHNESIENANERIHRYEQWIYEGNRNLQDIYRKISDIEQKIHSAQSKIR
jgi:prefoldin subunit 5